MIKLKNSINLVLRKNDPKYNDRYTLMNEIKQRIKKMTEIRKNQIKRNKY